MVWSGPGRPSLVLVSCKEEAALPLSLTMDVAIRIYKHVNGFPKNEGEAIKVLKALEAVIKHLNKFLVDCCVLPLFENTRQLQPHKNSKWRHHGLTNHDAYYWLTARARLQQVYTGLKEHIHGHSFRPEVIPSAEFHPTHCHTLAYSSFIVISYVNAAIDTTAIGFKRRILFKLDWSTKSQNEHHRKSVAFADGSNSNNDNSRLLEKLKAMDSQFQSLKEELQDMRNKYQELRDNHASKNYMNDDTPMCKRHEVNYIQSKGHQNPISHDSYSHQTYHDHNDFEKSLTELNNDVKNNPEDFKRRIRSMRTIHWKFFAKDDGKTTDVLPNKESKTINQEPRSKTDLEKSIIKFLNGQRVTNIFFKNNVNNMIIKMKQNEKNFQTKIKNMKRKINEWSKSKNISFEQTNRTAPPPLPQAHTEHVNAVFTRSGMSDDSLKILKDPPPSIIINNKIEKDRPIKTSKKGYHVCGALIPDDMINHDIKDSEAYKTYYDFATRKVHPKNARKYKKVASPSRKLSHIKEAKLVKKAKRVKRLVKKSTTAPTACVVIRDTLGVFVSKKKELVKADRSKGVHDEQQCKTSGTYEGTDYDEEEHDEEYKYDDDNENVFEEEDDDLYMDVDMRSLGAEHEKEKKGDEEITDADQNVSQENSYEQVIKDAHVTLTSSQKTESLKQSSYASSNFASKFLILDNIPPVGYEVASMINIKNHQEESSTQAPSLFTVYETAIPETSNAHAITVPPTISMITPFPQLTTPSPAPITVTTTTSIPALPDFCLDSIKETALESYTKEFEKKAQEERKLYIDVVEKSVKDILKDEVKSLLPQIYLRKYQTLPLAKSSSKSVQAEEPVFETADTEIPQDQGDDTEDQPNVWATPIDDCCTDQLDPNNSEGHEYSFDLSKPLSLIEAQGRQLVLAIYFFKNDLEYLKGRSSSRKYATSTTKTKAAKYDNIEGIKDMVLMLWSSVKKRIIVVTHVKVMKWYDYGYLEAIIVRTEDQTLHKFKEGDFPRLNLRDIEDLLLLLVQRKLSNLEKDVIFDLNVALWMFTRLVVIHKWVEDLQLGVESYQEKLNLTKPETFRSDISKMTPYTTYKNP
nr:RNA-binding KH domain-containing protein PEPPER-like [Tanacetum cinerariifolium]